MRGVADLAEEGDFWGGRCTYINDVHGFGKDFLVPKGMAGKQG